VVPARVNAALGGLRAYGVPVLVQVVAGVLVQHRFHAPRRITIVLAAAAAAFALAAVPAAAAAGAKISDPKVLSTLRGEVANGTLGGTHGTTSTCARFGCRSMLVTAQRGSGAPLTTAQPVGWGARQLERGLRLVNAPTGNRLVAIIGIGAYPNLESDLNIYRAEYGIAPCTTASECLTVANYRGGPALQPSDPVDEEDIAVETALDVQMVSAACPACRIAYLGVPVTFDNDGFIKGFGIATETAKRLGAAAVSISYGFDTNATIDHGPLSRIMIQPGMGLFSASGDFGYMNPRTFQTGIGGWPQNLRSVVSVGGTTMTADATAPTGFAQRAWLFAGSGCAPDLTAAYGQPNTVAAYCNGHRAVTDIAAVSDSVAVYDTYAPYSGQPYGWITVGGTSASSPFVAGISARAPRVNDTLGPNVIYRARPGAFTDITVGRNGPATACSDDGVDQRLCKAETGWDGATGRGVPRGLAPFTS
jgi:hypothetical protein